MLSLKNISKEELNEFVKNNKKSHFLQTAEWGEFAKKEKNMTPYYLGLVDHNDKILATALLLQKKLPLSYSYFYCPRGFIIDYNNHELLKEMTNKLKEFAKSKKALYIKIDPDIKLHNLDIDGNVSEGLDNTNLVKYLQSLGYKHLGYNKAFEHNQPRYTFRLELNDIDEVTKNFHKTTRNIITKGNIYDLEIVKNEENLIDDFYSTMLDTSDRENIALYSKEYFENLYKILHKNNMSDIYTIYLNKTKTKKIIEDKLNTLNDKKANTKGEGKILELNNQINRQEKLLAEIDEIKEDKYPLSAMITTKFNDKVWVLHGGNSNKLRILNSNYLIYYEIIKDACNENYKIVDFFGTAYNPDTSDPEYGIFLFKKRLGGEYTEFIGELDLITNKFMYFIFTKLIPIYRKIKKNKNKKEIKNEISKSN